MKALMARKADEMDMQTVAISTALSISFSADALAEWRSERGIKSTQKVPIAANHLGPMMARFPGAFKVH